MRIFVIGEFQIERFARHIAGRLERMGHEVDRYQPTVRKPPEHSRLIQLWKQFKQIFRRIGGKFQTVRQFRTNFLLQRLERFGPDLVLSTHDYLNPQQVDRIKRQTGVPVVLWYPDGIHDYGNMMFPGGRYDALFLPDPYVVDYLGAKLEVPVYLLPECFEPALHRLPDEGLTPEDREKFGCELTTAGTLNAYRQAFFRQLADYEVKFWGPPPPTWMFDPDIRPMYQGEYAAYETKAKAFRAADIVLNNLKPEEVCGLNARAFETCGIGGFQMIDWNPGLPHLFEPGEEVVTFRSMDELKSKIDYYLDHEDERREIAEAGRRRAQSEHTYRHRLETLLKTVFADGKGFPKPELSGF